MSNTYQVVLSNTSTGSTFWDGGAGKLTATATWGGASLKLQYLAMDESTWIDVDMTPLTADGMESFTAPQGRIKAVITGSPTAMDAWVHTV